MDFLNSLPGAAAQGLIWGFVAIGVYISYKILDIPDMTVDGSICTGAFTFAAMLALGLPTWVCMLAAAVAGALAGAFTGIIHTVLGIPAILAGILTQLALYSVNVTILDGESLAIIPFDANVLLRMREIPAAILFSGALVGVLIVCLWLFFYTEVGLTLKSTGDNPDMSRAQGINVNFNKVLGLALSNAIVGLAGAMYVQYFGSMGLGDGRGAIVIGLAAIFIGLSVSLKILPNFVVSLIGVVFGSIVYFVIFTLAMLLGMKTDFLKMFSAAIVILFIGVPYVKQNYFGKKRIPALPKTGGDENA